MCGLVLSNGEHTERMARRLRWDPFINELHDETHKNRFGQYLHERARRVQEEYDRQLAEAISQGSTVDHSLSFSTWKKVVGDKKKGKLYGLGNLAANYRKGSVASTLRLTLNHGEGSSQQPEEQLAQFKQAQPQHPSHTSAPVLSPSVEPYPVDEEDDVDGDKD